MAVNEVVYNGQTLINLRNDTVTPGDMLAGVTAHDASGESIRGSLSLAEVAYSGDYSDLNNTPTIPAAVAVKGDAESSYRTGNVNLTYANLGTNAIQNGGTGATNAANARSNLGLGEAATRSVGTIAQGVVGLVTGAAVYNALEEINGSWTGETNAAVGDTSCTISDSAITSQSVIDAYCHNSSGVPVGINRLTSTNGSATLYFNALTEATTFKLWIR